MPAKIILIGQTFGRGKVIKEAPPVIRPTGYARQRSVMLCQCGTEYIAENTNLRAGKHLSCGCLWRDMTIKHGHTKNGCSPEYKAWRAAKHRCINPTDQSYCRYGALGITMCARWRDSFENFLADMGSRPPGKSLDRYPDPSGNYEPGNCRWASIEEQANNKKSNRWITFQGQTKTMAQWSREVGINPYTIFNRLNAGWGIERTLRTPVLKTISKQDSGSCPST